MLFASIMFFEVVVCSIRDKQTLLGQFCVTILTV